MAEKNLSLKTTTLSNGIVERHNTILTEIIKKVKEENVISWEIATSWAVNAKNCLINVHGFSSYQIMYGRNPNPNLPSNIINKPPDLENKTIGEVMASHRFTKSKKSIFGCRIIRKNPKSTEKINKTERRRI